MAEPTPPPTPPRVAEGSDPACWREFGAFLDHMVHEVRTPLTSIRGYAALLTEERGALAPEHRAWLDVIEAQAARQHLQLDILMEIANLWSGRRRLLVSRVDLAALSRSMARRSGAEALAPAALYVHGDKGYLGGTIAQLLNNAQIHGAPPVRVAVGRSGEWVRIEVEDRGRGLPAGYVNLAGRRPFRLGEGAGIRGGTGFGLVLAGAVAEAHGGALRYDRESEVTRFTLTLPSRR